MLPLYTLANNPQKELAKIGYISEKKKQDNLRILLYFGNLLELVVQIWKFHKSFPANLATLAHLFSKIFFL
jgi:hypothetical protein